MPTGLLQKWMFSHLSPEKPHKCVLKASEQCSFFQDNWFEGSHPYVYLKNLLFSHLCPWKHYKCVLKASEQRSFFQDDWFEGSYLEFHWKNLHFPIYVLGSTINVCWNPHNMACFSKTIDLRGHMPRFTWKMYVFHLCPWKHNKCVLKPSELWLVFPRQLICGVTCLGLL